MRGTNGQVLLIGADTSGSGKVPDGDGWRRDRRRFGGGPGLSAAPAVLEDAAPYAGIEEPPGGSGSGSGDTALPVEVVRPPVPLCALRLEEHETGRLIAALGPVVRRGVPLFCLDGGNAFNPYRLAVLIRREGGEPFELLDRIYVSRAYTCHQLVSSAETLLGALIAARPRPMVAVLGIDRLFHDEDLPMWEREFLYGRLLTHVRALHRRGLPVLATFSDELKGPWARRLRSVARIVPGPEAVLGRLEAGLFGGENPFADGAPTELADETGTLTQPSRVGLSDVGPSGLKADRIKNAPEVLKANPMFMKG